MWLKIADHVDELSSRMSYIEDLRECFIWIDFMSEVRRVSDHNIVTLIYD